MLYKLKMYNLLPYIKINNDIPKRTVIFDLSFALDFSIDTKPVEEMFDMSLQTDNSLELLPEHFLVHMCCRHYREASKDAYVEKKHLMRYQAKFRKLLDETDMIRIDTSDSVPNVAFSLIKESLSHLNGWKSNRLCALIEITGMNSIYAKMDANKNIQKGGYNK